MPIRACRSLAWTAAGMLACMLAWTGPSAATASLTCAAEDKNMTLELLGNLGRGDGAAIQLIGGSIKLKAVRDKFPASEFEVGPSHLAGQWSFGKELRIGISPEAAGDVSVFLAIIAERTKGGDDGDRYRGTYVLKVTNKGGETELKGRLKGCSAG